VVTISGTYLNSVAEPRVSVTTVITTDVGTNETNTTSTVDQSEVSAGDCLVLKPR